MYVRTTQELNNVHPIHQHDKVIIPIALQATPTFAVYSFPTSQSRASGETERSVQFCTLADIRSSLNSHISDHLGKSSICLARLRCSFAIANLRAVAKCRVGSADLARASFLLSRVKRESSTLLMVSSALDWRINQASATLLLLWLRPTLRAH